MIAPLGAGANIKQGIGLRNDGLIILVDHLLADSAVGPSAPQPIQMLVVPDRVHLPKLKARGVHQRRDHQRAFHLRRVNLIHDMRQNQRRLNFQPAGPRLRDQHGASLRPNQQMQGDMHRETAVRLAGFEEPVGFFALFGFYCAYFHQPMLQSGLVKRKR